MVIGTFVGRELLAPNMGAGVQPKTVDIVVERGRDYSSAARLTRAAADTTSGERSLRQSGLRSALDTGLTGVVQLSAGLQGSSSRPSSVSRVLVTARRKGTKREDCSIRLGKSEPVAGTDHLRGELNRQDPRGSPMIWPARGGATPVARTGPKPQSPQSVIERVWEAFEKL